MPLFTTGGHPDTHGHTHVGGGNVYSSCDWRVIEEQADGGVGQELQVHVGRMVSIG